MAFGTNNGIAEPFNLRQSPAPTLARRAGGGIIMDMTPDTSPIPCGTEMEKSQHQQSVELFMEKASQDIPATPTIPSAEVRILRAKLIYEEAMETIQALGVGVRYDFTNSWEDGRSIETIFEAVCEPNLVEIADGCCDIAVVATGTLSACGIADAMPQQLVNESNLRKFGPSGYRREDGKWIKPPDWKAPDLASEIERQKAVATLPALGEPHA